MSQWLVWRTGYFWHAVSSIKYTFTKFVFISVKQSYYTEPIDNNQDSQICTSHNDRKIALTSLPTWRSTDSNI